MSQENCYVFRPPPHPPIGTPKMLTYNVINIIKIIYVTLVSQNTPLPKSVNIMMNVPLFLFSSIFVKTAFLKHRGTANRYVGFMEVFQLALWFWIVVSVMNLRIGIQYNSMICACVRSKVFKLELCTLTWCGCLITFFRRFPRNLLLFPIEMKKKVITFHTITIIYL